MEGRGKFLTVNVYPFGSGWRVAVLLKEAGRPMPRLLRTVGIIDLPPDTAGLPGALAAAADVLRSESDRLLEHSA